MTLLALETHRPHRKLRGREKRNITLNTKLTPGEFAEIEGYCEAHKIAFSEWVRDVVLREVRGVTQQSSTLPLLGEITGVRLLLVNGLEPLLRGEKMAPEQFKAMLQYVKANKRKAAEDTLASYTERGTDQS